MNEFRFIDHGRNAVHGQPEKPKLLTFLFLNDHAVASPALIFCISSALVKARDVVGAESLIIFALAVVISVASEAKWFGWICNCWPAGKFVATGSEGFS